MLLPKLVHVSEDPAHVVKRITQVLDDVRYDRVFRDYVALASSASSTALLRPAELRWRQCARLQPFALIAVVTRVSAHDATG
jgi:hypothetical protein